MLENKPNEVFDRWLKKTMMELEEVLVRRIEFIQEKFRKLKEKEQSDEKTD